MINAERLTVKAAEALNEALSLARRNGNPPGAGERERARAS